MYKVIAKFKDLQDEGGYLYEVGETFPREGVKVSKERYSELASSNNKAGFPVIQEVPEKKKTEKKIEKPANVEAEEK